MENPIRTRVIARLDALGLKPSSAAVGAKLTAAGLNRTYLYEFVSGKKDAINPRNIPIIAEVLDVTPEYLLAGKTDAAKEGLGISGICEAGAWRETQPDMPLPISLPVDNRFPLEDQRAYLVRGSHAEAMGIIDGSVLVVATTAPARAGDVVVVTRHRGRETEITVTRFENAPTDSTVAGVVLFCLRTF